MSTRSYVPNADGEGSIGVDTLKWGAMYVKSPAEDDNSQKVPSTAWVQNLISAVNTEISSLQSQMATMQTETTQAIADAGVETLKKIFPVGSVYTSLTDSRNPSQILGFGTWEALPVVYTLIAQGSGSDSFGSYTYTAGQKYGERLHKLTTDELPEDYAKFSVFVFSDYEQFLQNASASRIFLNQQRGGDGTSQGTATITLSGGGESFSQVAPSVACYCWHRTA